jgi:hypothetical protein
VGAEDEGGVGSAEAEGVGHGVAHGGGFGLVFDEAEGADIVEVGDVGGGWGDLIAEGEDDDASFEAACTAEEVAGHGFGGADEEIFGVVAEGGADGGSFGAVAERGGGGVGVEVLDVRGREACVFEGELHDAADASAVFGWGVGMEGVGVGGVAYEFGEDGCAAPDGVFALFDDEDAGAFADDEAVAIGVPGAGGGCGVVVAGGEGAHGGESGDGEGSDGGFAATADHDVGVAALYDAEGFADGVGSGGAGGGGGDVGAGCAVLDGDLAGCEIGDGRGDEEGGDAAGAGGGELGVFALDDLEGADAAADVDSDALGVFGGDIECGLLDGHVCGGEGELDEAAVLLDVFAVDEVFGVEVFDLTGELAGVLGGVEEGDGGYAGLALEERLPGWFGSDSYWTDEAYSGYDDTTFLSHSLGRGGVLVGYYPLASVYMMINIYFLVGA